MPDKDCTLKRFDIIKVDKSKYIVYELTKTLAYLLPIDFILENSKPAELVPQFLVSRKSLAGYEKLDSDELLYLINQKNPLIVEALENFLNEEDKSRKN